MDTCSRGALVTVALQGDYGKPRPAVVIQSDYFADLGTVVVLPVTSTRVDAPLLRLTLAPSELNNLRQISQVRPLHNDLGFPWLSGFGIIL
jgi:mRNA interferase MazF